MRHLFTPEGEAALAGTLRRLPLLAFDFDGTLAAIVARPADARLSQAVSARLAALSALLPLAIVTGRGVEDVRARLGFEPRYIVGNHGAEEAGQGETPAPPPAALLRLRQRLQDHGAELSAAGVSIEDKGHSMALHYRLSRTPDEAQRRIDELLADPDTQLRVFGGKMVVNVVARDAPDKADAVHELVRRCGASCAVFAGDDINDEPVFESAPAGWLTIRVGRDVRQSKAAFFLDSPAEMAMLLERMVTLLGAH